MSNLSGGIFGSAAESNSTTVTTSNSYNSSLSENSSVDRTGNVVIGSGSSGLFSDANQSVYNLIMVAIVIVGIVIVMLNRK